MKRWAAMLLMLVLCCATFAFAESTDGFVIEGNVLVRYNGSASALDIPAGVTVIGKGAFSGCTGLKRVALNKVTTVNAGAFSGCTGLEQVYMSSKVTTIASSAFAVSYPANTDVLPNVTIYTATNSTAHKFAVAKGIKCKLWIPDETGSKGKYVAVEDVKLINLSGAKVTVPPIEYKKDLNTGDVSATVELNGKKLRAKTDYTIRVKGKKAVGVVKVTITGTGRYTGSMATSMNILPQKVTGLKLTPGKKKLTIQWKKAEGITSYQVRCSTKKDFSSDCTLKYTNGNIVKVTLSGLKANTKYYVSIRSAQKIASGKGLYSKWCAAKSAKTKK